MKVVQEENQISLNANVTPEALIMSRVIFSKVATTKTYKLFCWYPWKNINAGPTIGNSLQIILRAPTLLH